MTRIRPAAPVVLLGMVLFVVSGFLTSCRSGGPGAVDRLRQEIFEAEDSRAPDGASLAVLLGGLAHSEPEIRRMAVRALGRLVRPALADEIAPLLSDTEAGVRAEAANALAQSVTDIKPAGREAVPAENDAAALVGVFGLLENALGSEADAQTRGVILRSIGRLTYPDEPSFRRAETLLLKAVVRNRVGIDTAPGHEIDGAIKGIEALLRRKARALSVGEDLVENLKSLVLSEETVSRYPESKEQAARIRRLALMALTWAGRLDEATLEAALAGPDEQVRRLVFFGWGRAGVGAVSDGAAERLIARGLADRAESVRYEALRMSGRMRLDRDHSSVLKALEDSAPHVVLLAIDLLGQMKPAPETVIARLKETAGRIGAEEAGKERSNVHPGLAKLAAAHALVSLAKTSPSAARELMPRFLGAPGWVVRMYAASAAAILKDIPALERLLADFHDNVRNEALSGLIGLRGHEADEACAAALERDDHQLILTAVRGLKGSPSVETVVPALLSTLSRLTGQRRETSRDPRLALIERIGELGSFDHAGILSAYAEDYDPLVAAAAADVVARWTGHRPEIRLRPLSRVFPQIAEIEMMRSAVVRVTMAEGGMFEMALDVDEAPATVSRFTDLVRAGYYDGLTFHRIVSNFLVQGGSPGANEFAGDALFMRDESGLASNLRGTVGISTRGRDTGDAQIYINTADNDRLDHDYCVFARVTAGMDVVDSILEGDVIARIEIVID